MALFVPGGVVAGGTVSGKMGGIVFSRNRFGAYMRARVVPVNPKTPQQTTVRDLLSNLAIAWLDTLTAAQRSGWATYAANVSTINRVGLPINLTGLNWYCAVNVLRQQSGLARVDTPPGIFELAPYTAPVFTLAAVGDTVSIAFTGTDQWVSEDNAALAIFISVAKNQTINFFNGPYRLLAPILGDSVAPPASPLVVPLGFDLIAGQRMFFRANVVLADGRIGLPTFAQDDA